MAIQEVLQRCTYYTSIKVKMKAIARIMKLKGSSLVASEQHTNHSREIPNANPDRNNQRLINAGDNDQILADMIGQRLGQQKYRKDAVLYVEMLLSVSPEYFRSNNPAIAGH
jgi:Plasmid recombination enzyme